MLTWNVTYHCKMGQRRGYDYYFAAEAPDDLLLVESWESPALQKAHCETAIFAELQALKIRFCESVEIDKFQY